MIAAIKRKKGHPRPPNYRLYQFKITLQDITPAIWRRIQVPETYSFWDLHVAIQDSMGWKDCHLHMFRLMDPKTGGKVRIEIPIEVDDFGDSDEVILMDYQTYISNYFTPTNTKAVYEYDFGDGWTHDIEFEAVLPKVPRLRYPKCIGGERNCPPEDCGSSSGYQELVEAMKNPNHPRRKEFLGWLGFQYHPDIFKPEYVCFDNPRARFEQAFGRDAP